LGDSLSYFVIECNGEWLASMGCDAGIALRRGWLQGPHVPWTSTPVLVAETPEAHREALRAALGRVVQRRFEGRVSDVSAYVSLAASELIDYYRSRGFVQRRVAHVFRIDRAGFAAEGIDRQVNPPLESQRGELVDQFRAAFPRGSTEIDLLNDGAIEVRVAEHDGRVAGFVVFGCETPSCGEIKFLAVREDCRRNGWGRRLLLGALQALAETSCDRVMLSVDDSNGNARSLYESVGFRLAYSGASLWGELSRMS
jgi:GNAT superfamily N-acetyltransferase